LNGAALVPPPNDNIEEFWRWLETRIDALAELRAPAQSLWDEALLRLQQVDENLRFEISDEQASGRELIVTAAGNAGSFPTADALVSAAPEIKGWTVISLRNLCTSDPRRLDSIDALRRIQV
jgi:hypothetical protein